jgi:hypothetical protein
MNGPDSPEALARLLREETAGLRVDPFASTRAIEAARRRVAIERPALLVVAFAASLSLWFSLQGEGAAAFDGLEDSLDAAEASL